MLNEKERGGDEDVGPGEADGSHKPSLLLLPPKQSPRPPATNNFRRLLRTTKVIFISHKKKSYIENFKKKSGTTWTPVSNKSRSNGAVAKSS